MASSFRSANGTAGVTSSSERIRREWQNFQVWLAGVQGEEEETRQKEFEELARATEWRIRTQGSHSDTITKIQTDFEKERKAMWNRLEGRVASRAKQEWDVRLHRADLKMEQWTDITLDENSAVAAVMWGVSEYDEDPIITESSDEADNDASSSSITPTPSMSSSRGPQLWTPPYVSRAAELPAPSGNAPQAPFHRQWNNTDKTPSGWGLASAQSNVEQGITMLAKTVAEGWLTQNTSSEQNSKPRTHVVAPKLPNHARVTTLLAPSHDGAEDESYDTDVSSFRILRHVSRLTIFLDTKEPPVYQKVPGFAQRKPRQTDTAQPKVSALAKAPQPRVHTQSNTSVKPNVHVAAPKVRTVELLPTSPDPAEADLELSVRKQIEGCLWPMYHEAKESFEKALNKAPVDEATRSRLAKEHGDIQRNIRRIAEEMYVVKQQQATMGQTERERQQKSRSKANIPIPAIYRGVHVGQSGGPESHIPNVTLPSPPQTPHSPTRYIGPILTDEQEEDLFDDVTLVIRKQQIIKFHEAAAESDIRLAEVLHEHKREKRDKREIRPMLMAHQREMEELQMAKEQERKEATEAERRRRRAAIAVRAQDREISEHHDANHKNTEQRPRSNSSQQKHKEDQTRWFEPSTGRSQTRAGHAVDASTGAAQQGQITNGTSKSRTQGLTTQRNRSNTVKPSGSNGLFSMDPVDHRGRANGTNGLHFGSGDPSRITPLTPTVLLPEIYSDGDDDDTSVTSSTDDDESSLESGPDVDHKRVRFTPSVLADNSTDSNDRGSFSNTLAQRTGAGSDTIGVYRAMPGGLGNGRGTAGRGVTTQMKMAGPGSEEGREEKSMQIWYPTGDVKGKGK